MSLAKVEALYLRHYRLVIPTIIVVTALLWTLIGQRVAVPVFCGLVAVDVAMVIMMTVRGIKNRGK